MAKIMEVFHASTYALCAYTCTIYYCILVKTNRRTCASFWHFVLHFCFTFWQLVQEEVWNEKNKCKKLNVWPTCRQEVRVRESNGHGPVFINGAELMGNRHTRGGGGRRDNYIKGLKAGMWREMVFVLVKGVGLLSKKLISYMNILFMQEDTN